MISTDDVWQYLCKSGLASIYAKGFERVGESIAIDKAGILLEASIVVDAYQMIEELDPEENHKAGNHFLCFLINQLTRNIDWQEIAEKVLNYESL